jgi:glyoxylase-like metal-dependent hydrolase (beta-lactamase superfamily II)
MRFRAAVLISFLACPVLASAQDIDYDSLEITTIPVTYSIYILQFPRGGNLALSLGEDGTFLIDAHFEATNAKVAAAIAELTDRPVDFVVNSHFHFDHTGGNKIFGPAGSIIVSQDKTRKRMESDQYVSAANIIQESYEEIALPKITFFVSMRFYYNGNTIDLFYNGPGHTDGDAQIYFREANVFHSGDLFVRYGLPFIDRGNGGSMDGMIDG